MLQYLLLNVRSYSDGFLGVNLRERDHMEDPGVDGGIILRRIFRKWDRGGMDLIDLAQKRDRWRALLGR
jgi:hypothetical protein